MVILISFSTWFIYSLFQKSYFNQTLVVESSFYSNSPLHLLLFFSIFFFFSITLKVDPCFNFSHSNFGILFVSHQTNEMLSLELLDILSIWGIIMSNKKKNKQKLCYLMKFLSNKTLVFSSLRVFFPRKFISYLC